MRLNDSLQRSKGGLAFCGPVEHAAQIEMHGLAVWPKHERSNTDAPSALGRQDEARVRAKEPRGARFRQIRIHEYDLVWWDA